ncbi:hypothetical protein CRYO30217_00194 [Parvicella tangerina]|uniref:Uncharacterized protein n=2 Tax=Parvicella tangerina TaxID=2829795 RepID=A0A916JJH6_9FLAO|nr:hypothetical protein CRYO30217_00194 [Parvicella tangerina]
MEEAFLRLLRKGTITNRVQTYVFYTLVILVIGGNLVLINKDNYEQNLSFILVIAIVFGLYYWFNRYRFKPLSFWIELFEHHPEDLIWVKPITTNHNALLVITYSKSYQFQLYLKDGTNIKIDCPESSKKTFYRLLREHAPHAHVGYSRAIQKVYRKHRERFLQRLNEKGLLRTVKDYGSL